MPTWVFHGAKDGVVPLKRSEDMVAALKAGGNDVKFTVYPDANHDSWTATYDNPELYTWLLSHSRHAADSKP
jgi:dipeptidyl aminopeptidase/acylaminoacyl peptidase